MRLKSMQNSPLRLRLLQKGKRRRLQHRNLLHPPRRRPQLALHRSRELSTLNRNYFGKGGAFKDLF
jgi:hypothetical protein